MEILQILKALGDETRLRILNLLKDGELCVCELEDILQINQSNASKHLNRLRDAKLIVNEKRALYVYYKLNEKAIDAYPFIKELIYTEYPKIEKFIAETELLTEYRKSGTSCEQLPEDSPCK